MEKILFVCLGNICRSPLAKTILKKQVAEKGLAQMLHIDSAGTADYHIGKDADARTRKNALKNNLEIIHKARQISPLDLEEFDYILAMDRNNYHDILKLSATKSHHDKIYLMRSFTKGSFDIDSIEADVPDPYYGGEEGFQEVYDMLEMYCGNFLDFLTAKNI